MFLPSIEQIRQASLPDQNTIIASWSGTAPVVSIVCITFNHESYIDDAIRGFLLQKTNFPFEIVIHDDASTDKTPSIIRHYAEAYPRLITSVFQKTSQKKLGKRMNPLAVGYSKGQYIALCEGDDFWLSEEKLQRQMEAMQDYPACDLSFHAALALHPNGELSKMADHSDSLSIIPVESIISADGSFCPTASLMLKRKVFDQLPDWFFDKAPVGDYYLQVFGALSGGALYLPSAMAVYRAFASNSWSSSLYRKERNEIIAHSEKTMGCLSELDRYTVYKYSASINRAKSLQAFSIAILFLKKKYIKDAFRFIKISWSCCRRLFISQLFVLSKKQMRQAIFGR
jgi:glycosyltransferase involved in cell wall biosynthesis